MYVSSDAHHESAVKNSLLVSIAFVPALNSDGLLFSSLALLNEINTKKMNIQYSSYWFIFNQLNDQLNEKGHKSRKAVVSLRSLLIFRLGIGWNILELMP